jgi:hypothetical protein
MFNPKNEPLSQEMYLETLRLSVGLKLLNSKLGGREAALYIFVNQLAPIDYCRQADSDNCNYQIFLSSYVSINPCFIAGKIIYVQNCHTVWL